MKRWLETLIRPTPGWPAWAVMAVLVIAIQGSFWWLSTIVQKLPQPPKVISQLLIRSALVTRVDITTPPATLAPLAPGPEVRKTRLPMVPPERMRNLCTRGQSGAGVRVQGAFDTQPGGAPKGLLVQFAADNVAVYLNGQLIDQPRGKFDAKPSRDGRLPYLLTLPDNMLVAGTNRFDLLVRHNGCLPIVTHVQFGDYGVLDGLRDKGVEMRIVTPWLAAGLATFVGLIGLMLLPIADNRRLFLSFGLMMIALAARSYYSVWNDWRFDQAAYAAVGAAVSILNGATIADFVFVLSRKSRGRIEEILLHGVTFALMALVLLAYLLGWTPVLTYADAPYLFVAAIYAGVRLLLWFRRDPAQALWPLVVFSVYVVTAINSQITSWLLIPMTFNTKHLLPFYLATGLGVIMLYRGFFLYRQAEAARASLAIQVAEKEEEIRESYLRLREQERLNAINTERQRLIADMHDGVGGQLMSLLAMARSKRIDTEALPQALKAIIDDLRLIIDSMDSAGDDLQEALHAFRDRILPRLAAAEIEAHWSETFDEDRREYRPQQILQIYRLLQESITNVIKHAGATRLDVEIVEDDRGLEIRVSDNGLGMPSEPREGRGLLSMRRRIGELGGALEFSAAEPSGTRLTARIPRG